MPVEGEFVAQPASEFRAPGEVFGFAGEFFEFDVLPGAFVAVEGSFPEEDFAPGAFVVDVVDGDDVGGRGIFKKRKNGPQEASGFIASLWEASFISRKSP